MYEVYSYHFPCGIMVNHPDIKWIFYLHLGYRCNYWKRTHLLVWFKTWPYPWYHSYKVQCKSQVQRTASKFWGKKSLALIQVISYDVSWMFHLWCANRAINNTACQWNGFCHFSRLHVSVFTFSICMLYTFNYYHHYEIYMQLPNTLHCMLVPRFVVINAPLSNKCPLQFSTKCFNLFRLYSWCMVTFTVDNFRYLLWLVQSITFLLINQ